MPTIDPITGKQLSGAAKAKRAKEREIVRAAKTAIAADVVDSPSFQTLSIEPPPRRSDDIAVWAQIICQRISAMLIRDKAKAMPTAMAAIHLLRNLPKMRAAATMSEQAVEVESDGAELVLDDNVPPLDPLAGPAWAYRRVAVVAYDLLTGRRPLEDLPLATAEIETAKLTCQLAPGHLIDVIIARADK